MLYNYGAAILRAVGDTKRPLVFSDHFRLCQCAFESVFRDRVSFKRGRCGNRNGDLSADLLHSCPSVSVSDRGKLSAAFFKTVHKGRVPEADFPGGTAAGIQSTVINFSNVLLQSSVNSFGSIAMAGYTAANNIFGFLYVSVNSVTQACMSFTSQNYGVRKPKRMDRVLVDCLILSFVVSFAMGCGAYFFGPQLLKIYTEDPEVIQCGMEILAYTTVTYFLCGQMDLFPGALRGMGRLRCADDPVYYRNGRPRIVWIFGIFPVHRSLKVLFISYPASWIITIIMQVTCFWFVRRKVHRQLLGENARIKTNTQNIRESG